MRQGCKVHFHVMEEAICNFGYIVGLEYNLSSIDKWKHRESQEDLGGYVKDVRDASTEEMGGLSSIG